MHKQNICMPNVQKSSHWPRREFASKTREREKFSSWFSKKTMRFGMDPLQHAGIELKSSSRFWTDVISFTSHLVLRDTENKLVSRTEVFCTSVLIGWCICPQCKSCINSNPEGKMKGFHTAWCNTFHVNFFSCQLFATEKPHSVRKGLYRGRGKVPDIKYTVKDVNSHLIFSLQPVLFTGPQGWSIRSLNLLEPCLILAEACRISVCFSLASLKGSPSFPFPFHCPLPAHQPGQLQQVIRSQRLSERGHTCTCASLAKESRAGCHYGSKTTSLVWRSQRRECSLCYRALRIQLLWTFISQTFKHDWWGSSFRQQSNTALAVPWERGLTSGASLCANWK